MKSKFKVQRLNGEWEMKLRRDKANKTTRKRVRRYTHMQLCPTFLYTFTEYFVFICNTANSQYLYADIADIQLNCWLSTTSHCYSGLFETLVAFSLQLVLIMSSSPAVFREIIIPQGVGVDTSLHTLERKKWSRGGEMGRGEKWRMEKHRKRNKLKHCS